MKKGLLFGVLAIFWLGAGAQDLKPKKDKETKKYGYVNEAGEWAVQPTFDDADKVKDGYGVIYMAKKRGLIDATGKVILEPRFDDIDRFKNGFAQVELNDKKGLINPDGSVLFEPQFDKIEKFDDGVAEVKTDGRYGMISDQGTVLFEPRFDRITSVDKLGNADVELDKKWGLINISGKVLFEPLFAEKLRFMANGLAITTRDGVMGIVKTDGTVAFEFKAKSISYESNSYVIGLPDEWRLYSENLMPISGIYNEMKSISGFGASANYIRDNRVMVQKDEKWGFIDSDGNEVIKPQFDEVNNDGFRSGFCAVKVEEKWGYIKSDGSWFKQPEFDQANNFVGLGVVAGANVMKDGKKYVLKNDGTLVDQNPAPAHAAPVASAAPATAQQQSLPAAPATRQAPVHTAAPVEPKVDENLWLYGTWIVEEEYMGAGSVSKDKKTKYSRFEFSANKTGELAERNSLSGREDQIHSGSWSLNGTKLTLSKVPYTITEVSADKRSMKLKGILGTWWKVKKR